MSEQEIERANALQADGDLFHKDGAAVERKLDSGFATVDGQLGYPVWDGTVALLADLAIVLEENSSGPPPVRTLRSEKDSVRTFYDEIGWKTSAEGLHGDTEGFTDTRRATHRYYERSADRIGRHLGSGGRYFLDAASGPIRFSKFAAFSSDFHSRICVDLSTLALTGARGHVGERGIYVLGDVTNLPLEDDSIDTVMSLATIYHVPRDEQPTAFCELHRVLKPGSSAVVSYSWGRTPWAELTLGRRLIKFPLRAFQRVARSLPRKRGQTVLEAYSGAGLYHYAHDYRWFVSQPWPFQYEVVVGHALTTEFTRKYIRERLLGAHILELVYRFEERFPRLAGRLGRHPLIIIRK